MTGERPGACARIRLSPSAPNALRGGVLFVGGVSAMMALLYGTEAGLRLQWSLNRHVAGTCAYLLRILGFDCTADGTYLFTPNYRVLIVNACNALWGTVLVLAAVLASPRPWRTRLVASVVVIALGQVLNQMRLLSVMLVGSLYPEVIHAYEAYVIRALVWSIAVGAFVLFCMPTDRKHTDEVLE